MANNEVTSNYGQVTKKGTIYGVKNCTLFEGNERKVVWAGEGTDVHNASSAYEVLKMADLNFQVHKEKLYTLDNIETPIYCTRRYDLASNGQEISTDAIYGAVGDKYKVIQNSEAMEFLDELYCHDGFQVETAGQFEQGKIIWVEARLPERYIVDEKTIPYIVFTNRHDGKGTLKVCLTPVRVVCQNTLAMSIARAARTFSVVHTESASARLTVAKEAIQRNDLYYDNLTLEIEKQKQILLTDTIVDNMLKMLFPIKSDYSDIKVSNIAEQRTVVRYIYDNAPDLVDMPQDAFRFISAVSDFATHSKSSRAKEGWHNRLFQNSLDGIEVMDRAQKVIDAIEPLAGKTIAMS